MGRRAAVRRSRLRAGHGVPLDLRGAAASLEVQSPNSWRIVRDPLGINKLFWAAAEDGRVAVASRPKRLLEEGFAFSSVRAIPRGSIIELAESRAEPDVYRMPWRAEEIPETGLAELAAQIQSTLARLGALVQAHKGAEFFVCLSGGLDSSGIAAIARGPGIKAVSFDLDRQDGESDDRRVARRLADDLGLPLICVTTPPMSCSRSSTSCSRKVSTGATSTFTPDSSTQQSPRRSQDRTGTHRRSCSPAISRTNSSPTTAKSDIAAQRTTGSLVFEVRTPRCTCPRTRYIESRDGGLPPRGAQVVQPYAVAVDLYLSLPRSLLESPQGKQRLGRAIFGDLLPDYIYTRPKVRAQVGSSQGDRGVLGLCIDHGIDSQHLRYRFALHGIDADELDSFIRGGTYRSGIPAVSEVASS